MRGQGEFLTLLIGGCTVLVSVGMVLSLIGVDVLAARVIYTLLTLAYELFMLHRIYVYLKVVFNDVTDDDHLVVVFGVMDKVISFFVGGSLLYMLFWVWGEDRYFFGVGTWESDIPFIAWIRFATLSILTGTGVGFGVYPPVTIGSQVFSALHTFTGYFLQAIFIASSLSTILRKPSKESSSCTSILGEQQTLKLL